jgi:hypothetical protein
MTPPLKTACAPPAGPPSAEETHPHERRVALVPSVVSKMTKLGAKLGGVSEFRSVGFSVMRSCCVINMLVVRGSPTHAWVHPYPRQAPHRHPGLSHARVGSPVKIPRVVTRMRALPRTRGFSKDHRLLGDDPRHSVRQAARRIGHDEADASIGIRGLGHVRSKQGRQPLLRRGRCATRKTSSLALE